MAAHRPELGSNMQTPPWCDCATLIKVQRHLCKSRSVKVARGKDFAFIPDLLVAIAKEPYIAEFITDLYLEDSQVKTSKILRPEISETEMDILADMFMKSKDVLEVCPDAAAKQDWFEMLTIRGPKYTTCWGVCFLLSMLPNLESLRLPPKWVRPGAAHSYGSAPYKLLKLLVERANNPALQCQPLQKLKSVEGPNAKIDSNGTNIALMFPLLSLHSVQTFHCYNAHLGHRKIDWDMHEQYPAIGPNLRGLYIDESEITSQNAGRLFQNLRQLRTLRFVYSEAAEGEFSFNANGFVRHLVAGVGDTLEDLSLLGLESIGSVHVVRYPLNGFKKLTRLELDLAYFIKSTDEVDLDATEQEGDDAYYGRKLEIASGARVRMVPMVRRQKKLTITRMKKVEMMKRLMRRLDMIARVKAIMTSKSLTTCIRKNRTRKVTTITTPRMMQ